MSEVGELMTTTRPPRSAIKAGAFETEAALPRYYQLQEALREQCAAWEPGQPIPSETELCRLYGISRTTVRKALEQLTREGLLYRIQGKGTFVAPPKLRERFVHKTVGIYEDMTSRGVPIRTQVLEQSVVPASRLIAPELQLVVGNPVIKLVRLRYVEDEPLLLSTTYLPYRSFPGLEHEDLSNTSLYALLREKYGIQLGYGTRLLEAVACSEEEARLLHIKPGAPLMVINGTMYDSEGHPVETGSARLRGDRSQIEIEVVPSTLATGPGRTMSGHALSEETSLKPG
jgi:GntR family transcriptional regulator